MKYSRDTLRSFKGIHTRIKIYSSTLVAQQVTFMSAFFQKVLPYICLSPLLRFGFAFKNFFLILVQSSFSLVIATLLAQVNGHVDSCAVSLLAPHLLDVNDNFLSVYQDYLADLLPLLMFSNHQDLVVLVDGHARDIAFPPQLLGEQGRLELPVHMPGGTEVASVGFAAV